MIISKQKVSPNTLLLAGIEDKLSMLLWSKTKDGQKGLNPPKLLVEKLMGIETAQKQIAFKSGEEFEQARNKLLGKEVK